MQNFVSLILVFEMKRLFTLVVISLILNEICGFTHKVDDVTCTFYDVTLNEEDTFPLDFNENSYITIVQFEYGNLFTVPNEIFNKFKSMKELHLQSQQLKEISAKSLQNARNLEKLYLYRNLIDGPLEDNLFCSSKKLKEIWLTENQISEISDQAFSGLKKLEVLYLNRNQIVNITQNLFIELESLTQIALGENKIEILHKDVFKFNPKLTQISLQQNKIIALNKKTFSHLQNLQKIYLFDNDCIKGGTWWAFAYQKISLIESKLNQCHENYEQLSDFFQESNETENIVKSLPYTEDTLATEIENLKDFGQQEAIVNVLGKIVGRLDQIEGIFGKLSDKLETLESKIDANEKILKEIREKASDSVD